MSAKVKSKGEEAFALHCKVDGLKPEREYVFCERKWRFDFAFPEQMVAVEIEGFGRGGGMGRHTSVAGFSNDIEKYNRATVLGWRVLRFTSPMVMSGQAINETEDFLRKLQNNS